MMKTILTRRAIEWENFLNLILKERSENGSCVNLKKPQLERIILHNLLIDKIKKDMVELKITEREEKWMRA